MRSMMFAIKAEVSDPWAETLAFSAQKTMYGGKLIVKGDRKKTRDRPANAAREHHHQTHGVRQAAPGAERAQNFFRLERRQTRDRAQFQILSSGHEQDRRHFG